MVTRRGRPRKIRLRRGYALCVGLVTCCLAHTSLARAVPLRYIAIGGGATPESTEVSLEQNLSLAQQVLTGPGALYFAGGSGSRSVRVLETNLADPLLVQLGDLFSPRAGRHSRYRVSELVAQPASLEQVEGALVAALQVGAEPLLLFVSAHGQQGDEPRANSFALWGGQSLSAARLAELHDAHPRPMRVVAASCFSGGFAELAFRQADAKLGVSVAPRCGLFAGTWDRETSGCDPDPDRRNQEGYSLHVLQALHGRDRDGHPLPMTTLDTDRDGRVSLLEAHARASIAGQSIDVPTTTSERYLRNAQRASAPFDRASFPEYAAIIDALGARLGLPNQRAAEARAQQLQQQLSDVADQLSELDQEVQTGYAALSGRLLGRWPELDDPYHPTFAATLANGRAQIADALAHWPEATRYYEAEGRVAALEQTQQRLELADAQVARLRRAYETVGLASALRRRGGARWSEYMRLLRCERYVP